MKRDSFTRIILLLALACFGCNGADAPSASNSSSAPSPAPTEGNANAQAAQSAPAGSAGASQAASAPLTLSGTYVISEVQRAGVVSMIDPESAQTTITFTPPATYKRESRRKGNLYHMDSGEFRIEDGNQLVFRIFIVNRRQQSQPKEARHTISVSPDGEEIKMTSKEGNVAVFRRLRRGEGN